MTKNDLKFVRSLIEQANPLKMINKDGSSCVFFSKRFCYVEALLRIYDCVAMTYLDIDYLLYNFYRHKASWTHSAYTCYFKPLGVPEHVLLDEDMRKNKGVLRNIIRAFHAICETSFDTCEFDNAFVLFLAEKETRIIKSTKELEDERNRKQ